MRVDNKTLSMEHYYFIDQGGIKKGPFKLTELKQQTIYHDELIWRSDNDQWKKASEFEELQDTYIIKPPPTPKEQKVSEINRKVLKEIILSYMITSLGVSILSFLIAQSAWEKHLKETEPYKYSGNYSSGSGSFSSELIPLAVIHANRRYPGYRSDLNLENYYAVQQDFLFRPFRAFFSTVYLYPDEQKDSGKLFINLTISSFVSLSFIFLFIGFIYFAIKRSNIDKEITNQTSNPTTT
jgi:hypothetical protein